MAVVARSLQFSSVGVRSPALPSRQGQRLRGQRQLRTSMVVNQKPEPTNNKQRDTSQETHSGHVLLKAVANGANTFLQRYDVLSCGVGALVVTTCCVYRGQDPSTALWITAASTVAALVINELMFDNQER